MDSDDESPIFAFPFQDLDYIPYGFSSDTAPYIETPIATLRAAATLMCLGLGAGGGAALTPQDTVPTVVCDLGCGDGEFLISLLSHINKTSSDIATGVGIDYDAALIKSAGIASGIRGVNAQWLIYDFNDDQDDLVDQLITIHQVTHVFIALVPKQLALLTVRGILTRLCESGVVVCCYKFHPLYLTPVRRDVLMDLVVYDRTSCGEAIAVKVISVGVKPL
ncbi:hypothetical protein LAWI1_G001641 [Lachnellula willkommii]|uniref:Methyltransferase domain-containing protein n=1 Tax=Lachnellula willkommii TaxID=215461 RepID=A0A559ML41_9HELO|nr:hypothetical protein LAWI1_G001641 [Lachnellula willkommii]